MSEPANDSSSSLDRVQDALMAVRHAVDVTVGSTGPNHPMREAHRRLDEVISEVEAIDRALATALRDVASQLVPFSNGDRLLNYAAVEHLERFVGRADVLFRLSLRSSERPPSRSRPLPSAPRMRRSLEDAGATQGPRYTSSTGLAAELDEDIYAEVLAVFAAEAREQLQLLNAALRRLRNTPEDFAAKQQVRRRLAAMKGSAALVGVEDVRQLAHAAEDLAVEFMARRTEPEDLDLLEESGRRLESLALGDDAERSAVEADDLLERLGDRTAARPIGSLQARALLPAEPDEESSVADADSSDGVEAEAEGDPEPDRETGPEAETSDAAHDADTRSAGQRMSQALAGDSAPVSPAWQSEQVARLDELVVGLESARSAADHRRQKFEPPMRDLRAATAHLRDLTERAQAFAKLDLAREGETSAAQVAADSLVQDLASTATELAALDLRFALASSELDGDLSELRRLVQHLGERVGRFRQVPLDLLARRFHSAVRRAAEDRGKDVGLILDGFDELIDQQLVAALGDAILPLLRNAVEHGVELPEVRRLRDKPAAGTVRISARRLGPRMVIEVADDGGGLAMDALRDVALGSGEELDRSDLDAAWSFASRPGVSTVRGRDGLGLDLVLSAVHKIGAEVTFASVPRRGATVTLRIPTDVSLTRALIVERGDQVVAVPSASVSRVRRLEVAELEQLAEQGTQQVLRFRGDDFTITDLASQLGEPELEPNAAGATCLLLDRGPLRSALLVDRVRDAGELAVYPAGPLLERYPAVVGFAFGDNDSLLPVLDPRELVAEMVEPSAGDAASRPSESLRPSVLVVDDVASVRRVVSLLIERLGAAAVAFEDGSRALEALTADDARTPSMALVDLHMPGMSGLEIAAELRQRGHQFPIYLFTSPADDLPNLDELSPEGPLVEGYVFKPLVRRELGALLRRHCEGLVLAEGDAE